MEGMRELERIVDKPELVLSAPMLLSYAHKKCETVGKVWLRATEPQSIAPTIINNSIYGTLKRGHP